MKYKGNYFLTCFIVISVAWSALYLEWMHIEGSEVYRRAVMETVLNFGVP